MQSRVVATLVVGLGILLAAAVLVRLAIGSEPDYARLVPAPDSIIWEKGQESTILISTNLDDVYLRIDSVAMGIESVQSAVPHSGELKVLGASVGCQDWAVFRLYAESLGKTMYTLKGNVDRDNFTATAEVFYRSRLQGNSWPSVPPSQVDVAGPDGSAFSVGPNSVTQGVWEIEASSDDAFPGALTRRIVVDLNEETSTTDAGAESIVLLKDTGVSLKACSEHDDLTLTLHGEDGKELNRYVVDIGPPPTATPIPATPVPNPVFSPAYETLRFCPDAASPPESILTGDEAVGTVTATGTGTISYSLAPDGDGRDFAYFAIDDSTGEITVSAAGADDHTGLDGIRLYTLVVRATDDAGRMGEALLAIQVDLSNTSTSGDGTCP